MRSGFKERIITRDSALLEQAVQIKHAKLHYSMFKRQQ